MSVYPAPLQYNGMIKTVFNPEDYSNYLNSTDQQQKNLINALATLQPVNSTNISQTATFSSSQSYDLNNGLIYSLASNSTVMTTISFTNIPITPQNSYIFTFLLTPSTASTPYYIIPNSNFVTINGTSCPLYGLTNITLPSTYTILNQQIIVINTSTTFTPSFIALTSVSGY